MSWNDPAKEDTRIYKVVMNHEEQYSIWPDYKEIPTAGNRLEEAALRQTVSLISRRLGRI
jgi:MbtH protein